MSRFAVAVSVSAAAQRDIDEAEAWLVAQAGARTAAFVLDRIGFQLERLASDAPAGAPIPRYGARVRFVIAAPYVIYYELDEVRVDVLRVLHRARDRDTLMSGG